MKKQSYTKHFLLKRVTFYALAVFLVSVFSLTPASSLNQNEHSERRAESAMNVSYAVATHLFDAPTFNATANRMSAYVDGNGNAITLNVQAEQTDGSAGKVTVTASSQELAISESFYRSHEKPCVLIISGPFREDMPGMPPGGMQDAPPMSPGTMPGMPPMGMPTRSEIRLLYDSDQQALTGTFSVSAPGSYMLWIEFEDGQTNAAGPARVNFRLQDKEAEPVVIASGEEKIASLAGILGWNELSLTVQSVEIMQSEGAADISPTVSGNAVNSLLIKGTRAGDMTVKVNVIYNGQPDTARITVKIEKGGPFPPLPPLQPLKYAPFGALSVLLVLFVVLVYLNFFKRIQGAFVARCECGATKLPMELKAPRGRSITLYQLLSLMLKQRSEDQDAEKIRGIVNDSDNKKNLRQIRIYVAKGEDKLPHYAFSKAGTPETILDDTMKKVYPDSGNRNSKLTVHLSFISQWNSIKRG